MRLADREVAALALLALAADDRERNDDPVALLELALRFGPDLDDLAHHLVSHDVAGQHGRDEVMEQMKVRAADGAARHLDDGVARILDLGVGDGVAADVFLAVPNEGSHAFLLLSSNEDAEAPASGTRYSTGQVSAGVSRQGSWPLNVCGVGKCCG